MERLHKRKTKGGEWGGWRWNRINIRKREADTVSIAGTAMHPISTSPTHHQSHWGSNDNICDSNTNVAIAAPMAPAVSERDHLHSTLWCLQFFQQSQSKCCHVVLDHSQRDEGAKSGEIAAVWPGLEKLRSPRSSICCEASYTEASFLHQLE